MDRRDRDVEGINRGLGREGGCAQQRRSENLGVGCRGQASTARPADALPSDVFSSGEFDASGVRPRRGRSCERNAEGVLAASANQPRACAT